jgi:hypothetical protein
MDNPRVPLESVPASRDEQLAALLASPPPRMVPREMLRAARRQTPSVALGIFGVVFGGMGLLFAWMFFPWNFYLDAQLAAADTATAAGQVLSADRTNLSINKQRVIRYEFSFPLPGGGKGRGTCFTTGQRWHGGEAARVLYRPGNPALCCLEGARLSEGSMGSLFVLVFPLVGGGLLAWMWTARRRVRALLERGSVAEARVTGVDPTSIQVNRQTVYRITLKCADLPGGGNIVLRKYVPAEVNFVRQRMATQQPVFVLYDPGNPRRALLPEAL